MERLLYGLALGVGFGLRMGALGVSPLATDEAAGAWLAWMAATGLGGSSVVVEEMRTVFAPTSPLLYSLQSILFWLMGGGDVVARAPAMVAGVGMVLLPWWLRPYLGRGVALLLACLIAVDPWLVAYSRLAQGTILSACFGLLALIGMIHLLLPHSPAPHTLSQRDGAPNRGWLWIAAISGGLLLVSGMNAWNFIPVLLLFGWISGGRLASSPGAGADGAEDVDVDAVAEVEELSATAVRGTSDAPDAFFDRGTAAWALTLLVSAAVLGATGWLARPEALGYISTSMTGWVNQFVSADPVYSWRWVLLRLVVDQPLILPFGLAGLVYLWRGRPAPVSEALPGWTLFLALWTGWGVVLLAVPGRTPFSLLMVGLPLLLAAAHALDGIVRRFQMRVLWRETLVLYSALIVLLVSSLFWAAALVSRTQFDVPLARISLVLGVLAILLVVLFALWVNARQALLAAALFAGCLCFLATLSSSWQLNMVFDRMKPDAFFAEVTDPDVRTLAENVATLSAQRVGDPDQLPLFVEMRGVPDPVLAWYLREMRALSWTPALQVDAEVPTHALLLSLGSALPSQISASYMGDAYALRTTWLPDGWLASAEPDADSPENTGAWMAQWSTRVQPLLRWIFYREVEQLPPSKGVVLWAQPS